MIIFGKGDLKECIIEESIFDYTDTLLKLKQMYYHVALRESKKNIHPSWDHLFTKNNYDDNTL